MMSFYFRIAALVQPIRPLITLLCVACFFFLVYLLVAAGLELQQQYLNTTLLAWLWALLFFVLAHSFYPKTQLDDNAGWWQRLKQKCLGFFAVIFTLFFTGLSLASLYVTYKILST